MNSYADKIPRTPKYKNTTDIKAKTLYYYGVT